jgi:hypothetical protein
MMLLHRIAMTGKTTTQPVQCSVGDLLIDSAEERRQFSTANALPRGKDRGLTVERWAGPPPYLEAATPNREERMTETFAAAANRRDC